MPACADMNSAMQELTATEFTTSKQHSECSEVRWKKDDKDTRALLGFLLLHNLFSSTDNSLQNISTGMIADSSVNADCAKDVGHSIIENMAGQRVIDFKFKKKDQVIPMDTKRCAKVDKKSLQIDLQLLFQRLVTAAMSSQSETCEIETVLKFELSTPPASLFD